MTIERQSEKTTGMYKLEYKEKISAEAEKLSTALQKVGSAAYEQAKSDEPKSDDPASPEGSAENHDDSKEENGK